MGKQKPQAQVLCRMKDKLWIGRQRLRTRARLWAPSELPQLAHALFRALPSSQVLLLACLSSRVLPLKMIITMSPCPVHLVLQGQGPFFLPFSLRPSLPPPPPPCSIIGALHGLSTTLNTYTLGIHATSIRCVHPVRRLFQAVTTCL